MVYCKEPMFGALLTISITQFIFNYKKLTNKSRLIYIALAANSLIFIFLYYFLVYQNTIDFYHVGDQLSFFGLSSRVFRSHKLLLLALVLAFIRLYFILFKKDRNHLFIDGLLFAGVAYTFEVLLFGLHYSYYFFPAVIFSLPSLIFWSLKFFPYKWITGIMLVSSLYCSFLIIDDIKNSQVARKTTYPKLNAIVDIKEASHEIFWFTPQINEMDPNSSMIARWKMDCFNTYLGYIIFKRSGKDPPEVSHIVDIIPSGKNLIMFPEEYHAVHERINIHNTSNPDNSYTIFTEVGGIVIYIN
jgi:hypothetical protein